MRVRATLAAVAALVTLSSVAQAQRTVRTGSASAQPSGAPSMEFGVDGTLSFGMDDQGTVFALPIQAVRGGYYVRPNISVEPSLGFVRSSQTVNVGGTSVKTSDSNLGLDVSALYHFSADRSAKQWYARPFVGFWRNSSSQSASGSSQSTSTTFTNIGVAGGIKIPVLSRMNTRVEAEYRHQLEKTNFPAQSWLNLNFGMSVYTR